MATLSLLPATVYNPLASGMATRQTHERRDTIIEDEPQDLMLPAMQYTPRQADFSRHVEFDDLYDVSEDEADDLPIVISLSPIVTREDKTSAPLEILSPTAWPSIHKMQKANDERQFNPALLSPPITVPQMKLSLLSTPGSRHSIASNAPSLDGSLTSEEMASMSCPSTPDLSAVDDNSHEWTLPVQLHPASLSTLDCLADSSEDEESQTLLRPVEMQERGSSLFRLKTQIVVPLSPVESGELSAISIPSPGGFFATLDPSARSAWMPKSPEEAPVATAVAENFYEIPWKSPRRQLHTAEPQHPRPHNIEIVAEDTTLTEGPPTARHVPAQWECGTPGLQALKSPNYMEEFTDYNAKYERQLRESSVMNIDRTATWLSASFGAEGFENIEEEEENSPEFPPHPTDEPSVGTEPEAEESISPKDTLLLRGFQHVQDRKKATDAFVHRKTRTEKLRLDRKCLFTSHVNQLDGKYTISTPQPVTAFKVTDVDSVKEEDKEKVAIANAVIEQKALQEMESVAWNVEATKYLNGGTLLTSPTSKVFKHKREARILDLGGITSCDWSWQVAIEYPDSKVHTVCTADSPIDASIATPKNHKATVVPNLWTLPFPANHFDCISARNVYALLKLNKPAKRHADEYDLCLRECLRVLRPGGYLEYALLDADIMSSGPKGAAMTVGFQRNLDRFGYDAAPTKAWLSRLRKAGFGQIRRAWLALPMSQHSPSREGSTADVSHISGMVGSWAWERWMLKLHKEMGMEEDLMLEGVAAVLEEGAKTGASWRYLSGWARKPY